MTSRVKTALKIAVAAGIALSIIGGLTALWYVHSPYFALQQIGMSFAKRDAETFHKFCDSNTLVTTLTNELFFQPAMNTPGMSQFQCIVAGGAIMMTKAKLDNALISNIDRVLTPVPHTSFYHVFPHHLYLQSAKLPDVYSFNQRPVLKLAGYEGDGKNLLDTDREGLAQKIDLRDVARNLGRELQSEQNDLKRLAAQRMQEYAVSHQDKLIGRLLAGPSSGVSMKSLLAEYGFQTENIKAIYVHNVDDREIATIEFFSPKVQANVPLSLELTPISPGEVLSMYKVIRVWKIKETMQRLGEDTDAQVQELIVCSMQDISPKNAENRTGNLLKRLGQHDSTKRLLQQLKGKF